MKLNNYGWGIKEFLWLLCALAFFFAISIILFRELNKVTNLEGNANKHRSNELRGSSSSKIKTYIAIEDKMVEAAKKYKIDNLDDTVIIKLDKLITNGYISIVRDPANDKECSGYIIYNGNSNSKDYKAYLSCAGNYQTSDYNANFE